jgi:hypothetical protein
MSGPPGRTWRANDRRRRIACVVTVAGAATLARLEPVAAEPVAAEPVTVVPALPTQGFHGVENRGASARAGPMRAKPA